MRTAYAFIGIGVGLAGIPASHSLPESVPVTRAGMASSTADLQRDPGGAIMQPILGAILAAGDASAIAGAPAAERELVTDSIQTQLEKSFAGVDQIAEQHPQSAPQIIEGARRSFVSGSNKAYGAGTIAIGIGTVLVFVAYPKKDGEEELPNRYAAEDARSYGRPGPPRSKEGVHR